MFKQTQLHIITNGNILLTRFRNQTDGVWYIPLSKKIKTPKKQKPSDEYHHKSKLKHDLAT